MNDIGDFKSSLQRLKNKFKNTVGLTWGKPHLRPMIDPITGDTIGWLSTLVLTFEGSQHFLRLKENWKPTASGFARSFFTYHYGPYELSWNLITVECRKVVVRVDTMSYSGRGFHIHDGAKENRIHQDRLDSPSLGEMQMDEFIENVLKMKNGKSLTDAFGLKFK